jgi:hypothetical protein
MASPVSSVPLQDGTGVRPTRRSPVRTVRTTARSLDRIPNCVCIVRDAAGRNAAPGGKAEVNRRIYVRHHQHHHVVGRELVAAHVGIGEGSFLANRSPKTPPPSAERESAADRSWRHPSRPQLGAVGPASGHLTLH